MNAARTNSLRGGGPRANSARGFTLVRAADGTMLRRASEVKPGAALDIEFVDGHVGAHADPRGGKAESPAKKPRRGPDDKQGSLL